MPERPIFATQDLQVFAAVARAHGLSAAARRLGVPKSSVSRSLTRLEAQAGATLLQRSTRSMALTHAGLVLLDHAVEVLGRVEAARDAVLELSGGPRGLLRIGAPVSFGRDLLMPRLPELLARHPALDVCLILESRRADVIGDALDLVVRVGPLEASGLIARKIAANPFVLCAAPALGGEDVRSPEQASGLTMLALKSHCAMPELRLTRDRADEQRSVPAPFYRLVSNDPGALLQAVAAGVGAAWLPEILAREPLGDGRLVRLLPEWTLPGPDIYAVFPGHRSASPNIRALIDFLLESFAAN